MPPPGTSPEPATEEQGVETVRITWEQDGESRESAVTYSPQAAEDYKRYKEAEEGVTSVSIVPAKL